MKSKLQTWDEKVKFSSYRLGQWISESNSPIFMKSKLQTWDEKVKFSI